MKGQTPLRGAGRAGVRAKAKRAAAKIAAKKTKAASSPVTPKADAPSLGGQSVFSSGPIHRGNASGRRTDHIFAPEIGPIAAMSRDAAGLIRRCRALQRQNPWARNARQTYVANGVGPGITPKFRFEPDAWGRTARDLWDECVPFWDAAGLLDFYGLQALGWGELFDAGEFFVRRRPRLEVDDLPVPLQIQLIEAEHCPQWYTQLLSGGAWIKSGIEFNAIGQRVAYWMYPEHPGEWARSFDSAVLKRIPAEQIAHVFVPERAESIRGCPHLARSILRLFGLDDYDDAELDRQRMAAMITGVLELLDPDKASSALGVASSHSAALAARGGGPITEIEPGTVSVAGPGESFKPFPPAEIGANYLPFHDHNLRSVAADCGLTYEMLTGDLSKSSYVSLRFGSLEFRRRCRLLQGIFNFQFNRVVTNWWLDQAILAGELSAPGYVETSKQRRAYQRVLWNPPAWDRIQPDKEIPADIAACRAGFTTIDRVVAERTGEDGAVIMEEMKVIAERLDTLELISIADARVPDAGGKTPTSAAKEQEAQDAATAQAEAQGKVTPDSGDAKGDGSNVEQGTGTDG